MLSAPVQLAEHGPACLVGLGDQTPHEERALGEQEQQGRDNAAQTSSTKPCQFKERAGGWVADVWHPRPRG